MEAEAPDEFLLLLPRPLAFPGDLSDETPAAVLLVAEALRDAWRRPAPVEVEGASPGTEEGEQAASVPSPVVVSAF